MLGFHFCAGTFRYCAMAVYTDVSDSDLTAFIGAFDLGRVLSFKGIAEGVENSNVY